MIGCPVAWKCFVACRLGELSQQPTCPQVRQSRRCTQGDPILRHSSHPRALGVTARMPSRCVQVSAIFLIPVGTPASPPSCPVGRPRYGPSAPPPQPPPASARPLPANDRAP